VDFLRRTPASLKRPAVENLIWVGGFEDFGLTRRELLWQAGLWLGPESDGSRSGGREDHAQTELGLEQPYAALAFRNLEARDRMVAEYRMLHFSAELHPLSLLADQLPDGTVTSDRLRELPQHATVRVAGLVTARQRPGTAKGYVFVLMEDEAGPVNVIVKPDVYERDRSVVRMEPFLAVRGRLQKDGDSLNVIAFQVEALRVPSGPSAGPADGGAGASAAPGAGRSGRDGMGEARSRRGGAPDRGAVDAGALHDSLPDTLEYWADPDRKGPGPFRYLTALRQSPPDVKSFG
jgi:error-prone DNA polymerase